ncbi:carboxymuconolactone decarboxylase family protein [Comamonas piscis]|uniref:Carboxymuconolactone decarboxylase family protein n=1 Tax=Comamonas piscis TaxID=1562974 RepID=A0A7G5EKX2_9BURK|nr:carboxymuconolactone decarboxylase family protein [Comamonas piscis]QMV74647.1 carboxymuconolactone decarboxylase family protein [Comamonas piscis]WSO33111.1 carboxymuconolactone decarboxylase family protein [Comamonas piscis]
MRNTTPAKYMQQLVCAAGLVLMAGESSAQNTATSPAANSAQACTPHGKTQAPSQVLSAQQQAILPIAAFAAAGDMARLTPSLQAGLEAGLSVSDIREVLVQLYAYAGFPRSLNALNAFMQLLQQREKSGIVDAPGCVPSKPIVQGDALRAAGRANQTQLVGAPVQGPLFDFAPAIGEYLQSHLFGAIFERDNLDWHSRELATVGMLSALPGAESQLQSHMRMSLNVGLSAAQLKQAVQVLDARVDKTSSERASSALAKTLAASTTPER